MSRCRTCGSPLNTGAVLCTQCGTHQSTGMNAKTLAKTRQAGKVGQALAVAGVVSVLCGVVWAVIAIVAGYEIGYLAIGVGGATGITVMFLTHERSVRTGLAASGLAVLGLFIAKILILQFGIPGLAAKEFVKDEEAMVAYLSKPMMLEKLLELAKDSDEGLDDMSEEEIEKFMAEIMQAAKDKWGKMSGDERKELADAVADDILSEVSFFEKLSWVIGAWDILWAALAVGAAFKLASGHDDD